MEGRAGAPGGVLTLAVPRSTGEGKNSMGKRRLPSSPATLGYISALNTASSEKSQTTARCVGERVCVHTYTPFPAG